MIHNYLSYAVIIFPSELNLAGNYLHRLPEEVTSLLHLRVINLSRNRFRRFPEALAAVTTLETIDLEENEIVGEKDLFLLQVWLSITTALPRGDAAPWSWAEGDAGFKLCSWSTTPCRCSQAVGWLHDPA